MSNFPDFNLDQCLEDALTFAAATPISLTTVDQQKLQRQRLCGDNNSDDGWMNHLTRSLHRFNQTHVKMLSKYAESNLFAKHQRGHCLVSTQLVVKKQIKPGARDSISFFLLELSLIMASSHG